MMEFMRLRLTPSLSMPARESKIPLPVNAACGCTIRIPSDVVLIKVLVAVVRLPDKSRITFGFYVTATITPTYRRGVVPCNYPAIAGDAINILDAV